MKINELRIGNLIYEIVDTPENPKYKDEFEIAGINAVYDTIHDQDDNITLLSCCEPIPLTEEWLLKLPKDLKFPNWIKYVHVLQNWYFYKNKCKKELIFK